MRWKFKHRARGGTLVEILVVVGIIAVLIALLLPAIIGAKRAARKVECMGNVRALTQAWGQYHTANMGRLVLTGGYSAVNEMGFWISWVANGPDEEGIKKGGLWPYTQTLRIYRCPSDPGERLRSYSGNSFLVGDYSRWTDMPATVAEVNDAASTFVFTEEALQDPPPGQPPALVPFYVSPVGNIWESVPAPFHRDGVNISFADGHCEFYRFSDPRTAKLSAPKTSTPNNPDLKQFQSWIGVNLARYQSPTGSNPSK